jgi:hypothetical protein
LGLWSLVFGLGFNQDLRPKTKKPKPISSAPDP